MALHLVPINKPSTGHGLTIILLVPEKCLEFLGSSSSVQYKGTKLVFHSDKKVLLVITFLRKIPK